MKRMLFAIVLGFFVVAGVLACGPRLEGMDQSKVPDNLRGDYQVFAARCSKCHSLARPLTSEISDDEQWVNYVNRMRRQPGSGISMQDQEQVLRFLFWYASEIRRKEAAKHAPPPPSASSTPRTPPEAGKPAPSAPSAPALPEAPPATPKPEAAPKGAE